MSKRFHNLPLVSGLSADGKDAFSTIIHPVSRSVNPGYPDSDNTASIRTSNNVNYNIEAPSALKDGSSKWSAVSFLNPNVLYTPGLIVAWVEGYKATVVEPIQRYLSADPTLTITGTISTSFGSETYLILGDDKTVSFSNTDNGNAIAYIKPVRDSHCPKSEAFSEWRTIGASNDIQMEVAELYKQGIIYAGQMPSPKSALINILKEGDTNGEIIPVPAIVDQISYSYVAPNTFPDHRDKLAPIVNNTIYNDAIRGDTEEPWYEDNITDIKEVDLFDFAQLPNGAFFIDATTKPVICQITDANDLQVKARCFDIKDGVSFTEASWTNTMNSIPYKVYPQAGAQGDSTLKESNGIPAGVYEIEYLNDQINLVAPRPIVSGDFSPHTENQYNNYITYRDALMVSNPDNYIVKQVGVTNAESGSMSICIDFRVTEQCMYQNNDKSWCSRPSGDERTFKYSVNGERYDYVTPFNVVDSIPITYQIYPRETVLSGGESTGIVTSFDLIAVDEGINYFTSNINTLTNANPGTVSNEYFRLRPPVIISNVSADFLYMATSSGLSAKDVSGKIGQAFGDFTSTIDKYSAQYKIRSESTTGTFVDVKIDTGFSVDEWLAMMKISWTGGSVGSLKNRSDRIISFQQWKEFHSIAKFTAGPGSDIFVRGRLILTTEAKVCSKYIAEQMISSVTSFPGANLVDPLGAYYKTFSAVTLTESILAGTTFIAENANTVSGFWAKLKRALLGIAKVLNIVTKIVEFCITIVSLIAVERTTGHNALKAEADGSNFEGDYIITSSLFATNVNLPLDRDSIQTMSQMDSRPAKDGSFQVARMYDRANRYAPGGATKFSSTYKNAIGSTGNNNTVKNYTADLFTMWSDSGTLCNDDFRNVLVDDWNDKGLEVTAKTNFIAKADAAGSTANNGFYNNSLSQTSWGCPVAIYTGMLRQAALRCRISRDLELVPVINQSLAPLASNPAQPDFSAIDVTLRYLNVLPILMPYKCTDPNEFHKVLVMVSSKILNSKDQLHSKLDAAQEGRITRNANRIAELDTRIKKLVAAVQNVNNRLNSGRGSPMNGTNARKTNQISTGGSNWPEITYPQNTKWQAAPALPQRKPAPRNQKQTTPTRNN